MARLNFICLFTLVLCVLSALSGCTTEHERTAMRNGLDSINQRNRNDQPFTVEEVEPYVAFFDDHGTPNDRMLAHYLLGRAHHENGEAPMALQCYHDAIDCADTTSSNCDFAQLSRVYSQMAELFYQQGLHDEEIETDKKAVHYAWLAKDTLSALMNYEQEYWAYEKLGYHDSASFVIQDVVQKYIRFGYNKQAAIASGIGIRFLINKGEYKKAKVCMDQYESESGRFNAAGDIELGREIYYKDKGLYYLYTNHLDSAEYYFRKELRFGKDYNNQQAAARGLALLYKRLDKTDSIAKFLEYANNMKDSLYSHKVSKEIERIRALYNYSRLQTLVHNESIKATKASRLLLICIIVLLSIIIVTSWLYMARKEVINKLNDMAVELEVSNIEITTLKNNNIENALQIAEREKRIKQLEQKLGKYVKLVYFGSERIENNLKISSNYQKLKVLAFKGQKLETKDWDIVSGIIGEYLPLFHDFATANLKVNTIEYQICSLLRLHFKTGEVANMLGVTPPYISKVSSEIIAQIFKRKGSSKELYKELINIK